MLGQRRQAPGKALGHATELPRPLATIELAEDQRGFLHALGRDRRVNTATHGDSQLRESIEAGLVLVDGRGQGDFFDGRVNGVQVDTEHAATGSRFHQLDRTIVDALLAEEAHVVVAAHLARVIEQERRHIQVCPRYRGVADGDAQAGTGNARIGARSQGRHARTAWAASVARSWAVRPLATVPIAVRSQPADVRLMYAMTTPV